MKNTILYAPLQYRYSLLSDENLTIGLLRYAKEEGEIAFIEGEKDLIYLQNMRPNLKPSLLAAYITLIQKKIQKYPVQKHLDKANFQQYIYQYILSPDDSSLQFGEIDVQTDNNEEAYLKKQLPNTFKSEQILQKFDSLFVQYLPNAASKIIHKNGKILPHISLLYDRAWTISGIRYFLWEINLDVQEPEKVLQKKLEKWRELHSLPEKFLFEAHFWLIPSSNSEKTTACIASLQKELVGISTHIYQPAQWVEYTKSIAKKYMTAKKAQIFYISLPDEWRKEEKLQWFKENKIQHTNFQKIVPDKNNNWLHQTEDSDWDTFLPICSKEKGGNGIFDFSSLGVSTNRDEWVYDFDKTHLVNKIRFFIDTYNLELSKKNNPIVAEKPAAYNGKNEEDWNYTIKWSRDLKRKFEQNKYPNFNEENCFTSSYRPFTKQYWYAEKILNDILTQNHYDIFGEKLNRKNKGICFSGLASSKPFQTLAISQIWSLDFLEKTYCLSYYRYDKEGNRQENITDWALEQFRTHYSPNAPVLGFPLLEKEGLGEVHNPHLAEEIHNPVLTEEAKQIIWKKIMNNPLYKEKRRELRQRSTPAETKLWGIVRNRQLEGAKFRHQYGVDFFILDFYCPEYKLAIELDGAHHYTPEGLEYDEMRTNYVSKYGIRVIRFENKEVFEDLEGVLDRIRGELRTSPNPSFTRRGSFADAKQLEGEAYFEDLGEVADAKQVEGREIEKEDIFHYVYAVLHNPEYRKKYELNLKREFPRIPFYADFEKWAAWGKDLMDLHIDYEKIEPFPLKRKETQAKQVKPKTANLLSALEPVSALFEEEAEYIFVPKSKLKAHKEEGTIDIDELTTLSGIPAEAWEYKLGNRSALEWVLDQYKESKPSGPTIAEKFNTYKFADYKETVIDLLMRVCRVSVETVRIVGEMEKA